MAAKRHAAGQRPRRAAAPRATSWALLAGLTLLRSCSARAGSRKAPSARRLMGGSPRREWGGWAGQPSSYSAAQMAVPKKKQLMPMLGLALFAGGMIWLEVCVWSRAPCPPISPSRSLTLCPRRRKRPPLRITSSRRITNMSGEPAAGASCQRCHRCYCTADRMPGRLLCATSQRASARAVAAQLPVARVWHPTFRGLLRPRPAHSP